MQGVRTEGGAAFRTVVFLEGLTTARRTYPRLRRHGDIRRMERAATAHTASASKVMQAEAMMPRRTQSSPSPCLVPARLRIRRRTPPKKRKARTPTCRRVKVKTIISLTSQHSHAWWMQPLLSSLARKRFVGVVVFSSTAYTSIGSRQITRLITYTRRGNNEDVSDVPSIAPPSTGTTPRRATHARREHSGRRSTVVPSRR